jgi:hypothetical protein
MDIINTSMKRDRELTALANLFKPYYDSLSKADLDEIFSGKISPRLFANAPNYDKYLFLYGVYRSFNPSDIFSAAVAKDGFFEVFHISPGVKFLPIIKGREISRHSLGDFYISPDTNYTGVSKEIIKVQFMFGKKFLFSKIKYKPSDIEVRTYLVTAK